MRRRCLRSCGSGRRVPPAFLSPWEQSLGRGEQGRVVLVGPTLLVSPLYLNLSPHSLLSIPLRSQGHRVRPHPTDEKAEGQERHTHSKTELCPLCIPFGPGLPAF